MTNVVKEIESNDPDIEKVFVYRGLRLGISKLLFPSGPSAGASLIRTLGIVNEDGRWVRHLSDVDANLANAEWQARHYVVDSLLDTGVYDGKYSYPDPKLYQQLQSLTNHSSSKLELAEIEQLVQTAKSSLDEAWTQAHNIKNSELRIQARDTILAIKHWFDED